MKTAGVDKKDFRIPKLTLEPIRQVLLLRSPNISQDDFLAQLGCTAQQYLDPAFSIDGEQFNALYAWVRDNTQSRISMRDWLSHFSATSAGLAGMAALSARNVRESLMVAVRYLPLVVPVMRAELIEAPPRVHFRLEMIVDLGEMNNFLLEIVTAAVHVISNDVMSEAVPRIIHFKHGYGTGPAARAHREDLESVFATRVIFNSSFNGMEGYTDDLDISTRSPNEATFNTVKRILEDEISAQRDTQAFANVVHLELVRLANAGQYPSLEDFSDRMNLSPRTLIRKLANEGTSFKAISNDVWLRLAKELLVKTQFPVKQVAARTGFTNTSSFSRAFKSLAGETPQAWRSRSGAAGTGE